MRLRGVRDRVKKHKGLDMSAAEFRVKYLNLEEVGFKITCFAGFTFQIDSFFTYDLWDLFSRRCGVLHPSCSFWYKSAHLVQGVT